MVEKARVKPTWKEASNVAKGVPLASNQGCQCRRPRPFRCARTSTADAASSGATLHRAIGGCCSLLWRTHCVRLPSKNSADAGVDGRRMYHVADAMADACVRHCVRHGVGAQGVRSPKMGGRGVRSPQTSRGGGASA